MTSVELNDLTEMMKIREFEERVRELSLKKLITGSVHLCIGQEAIAVGACSVLLEQDALFATYRGHGWALARGVPLAPAFGELLGRSGGLNGGRGGSAYFSSRKHGFYGENSIVAGGAPIAVGAALAARYDGSQRVSVVAFGDGAMNQGAMHEAMNFAAALKLPVVFVCENNQYSELTPIADMVVDPELWHRAAAYGMPGVRVDGNCVAVVRSAVGEAVDRARAGGGPTLVEATTERLVGHYIGDVEHYRPAGEVERALAKEPIRRLRSELLAAGVSPQECDRVTDQTQHLVQNAMDEALAMQPANPATVREHLYA